MADAVQLMLFPDMYLDPEWKRELIVQAHQDAKIIRQNPSYGLTDEETGYYIPALVTWRKRGKQVSTPTKVIW